MTATPIDFYFDFISPFGYFASLRIDAMAARFGRSTEWHSMLLGVSVMKVMGMKPIPDTPLKGAYILRDAARYARRHGIRIARPFGDPPSSPLPPGRTFAWVKRHAPELAKPVARALYDAYWLRNVDTGITDAVLDIAAGAGVDRARLREGLEGGEAAALLKEAVDRSLARGVFGSPFFIVDGEPFFGVEKMELLQDWLESGGW